MRFQDYTFEIVSFSKKKSISKSDKAGSHVVNVLLKCKENNSLWQTYLVPDFFNNSKWSKLTDGDIITNLSIYDEDKRIINADSNVKKVSKIKVESNKLENMELDW